MSQFRSPCNRSQTFLFPPTIEELVPAEDSVRYIDSLVDLFDLTEIECQYSPDGRPAYPPKILVKVILYGKIRGIRSCRKLARACEENIRFIFLAQGEHPDFRTIGLFRKRFSKELSSLLRQSIRIGLRKGVIDLSEVSLDGTLIGASANKASFHKLKELEDKIARIEKEVVNSFVEDAQTEAGMHESEDPFQGPLPKELHDKELRKAKLQAALEDYQEIEGKKPSTISTSDKDSRYMRRKNRSLPAYNCQASVDIKSGIVVGGYASNENGDFDQANQMVDEIEKNTGEKPNRLAGDKGYYSASTVRGLSKHGVEGFIPYHDRGPEGFRLENFTYDAHWDEYICPAGRTLRRIGTRRDRDATEYESFDCSGCQFTSKCLSKKNKKRKRKIDILEPREVFEAHRKRAYSDTGKLMSKKRKTTIEPTFGHIKYGRALRQFSVRGLEMVDTMWKLELCAHNLAKLANMRV